MKTLQLVATAALFLAAKSEETACLLNTVLRASCEVSQNQEFNLLPYMLRGVSRQKQYLETQLSLTYSFNSMMSLLCSCCSLNCQKDKIPTNDLRSISSAGLV